MDTVIFTSGPFLPQPFIRENKLTGFPLQELKYLLKVQCTIPSGVSHAIWIPCVQFSVVSGLKMGEQSWAQPVGSSMYRVTLNDVSPMTSLRSNQDQS